jgi:hypothetical protein
MSKEILPKVIEVTITIGVPSGSPGPAVVSDEELVLQSLKK